MNLSFWFGGSNPSTGMPAEAVWPWITIALSVMVAAGYCVIAVNWYFQAKLFRQREAQAALRRLVGICLSCTICGSAFFYMNTPWIVWRLYDVILLMLAVRTWMFVCQMRGLSLVNQRLAEIGELEETARKYREIAELLPQMVWTATPDGEIDFSNQQWRQYAGQERTWLEAVHPDELQRVRLSWNKAVQLREPLVIETRLNGYQGYRTFIVKATLIVQKGAVRWLGACADIEDQKQMALQKEMQAKQKSFFLNALSHDLRAPLHNVLLNAHLLKMSVRDENSIESIEMIVENTVAAGDLVSKLLDFAKVGAQDQNAVERVSIAGSLNQTVRRFLPLAEQKSLYLRISDSSDVYIMTDRQKFERIVSNLVDNAIKYTQQGGVAIKMETRGDELHVRVEDTGVGIPAEHVPYLFEEFYQVNNYERDRSKGFGMGLAICRCLARQIGGELRLASTGKGGSSFELIIKGISVDRGGRQGGAQGDLPDSQEAGLCRV